MLIGADNPNDRDKYMAIYIIMIGKGNIQWAIGLISQ